MHSTRRLALVSILSLGMGGLAGFATFVFLHHSHCAQIVRIKVQSQQELMLSTWKEAHDIQALEQFEKSQEILTMREELLACQSTNENLIDEAIERNRTTTSLQQQLHAAQSDSIKESVYYVSRLNSTETLLKQCQTQVQTYFNLQTARQSIFSP